MTHKRGYETTRAITLIILKKLSNPIRFYTPNSLQFVAFLVLPWSAFRQCAVTVCFILRGVIDKFVSFFHRIIIYGWIYIIFCHYQQQPFVNRKKTLKCKLRQTCDVTMTLMTSHVGDVVVKTLEDRCGWRTYLAINAILPVQLL